MVVILRAKEEEKFLLIYILRLSKYFTNNTSCSYFQALCFGGHAIVSVALNLS